MTLDLATIRKNQEAMPKILGILTTTRQWIDDDTGEPYTVPTTTDFVGGSLEEIANEIKIFVGRERAETAMVTYYNLTFIGKYAAL